MAEDTFFVVKEQILKSVKKAKKLYHTISDLTENAVPAEQEHLDLANADFQESIQSSEMDLEDLKETIQMAVNEPENYNIDAKEIRKRKEFVKQVSELLASLRDGSFDANKVGLPEYEIMDWPTTGTYQKLLNRAECLEEKCQDDNKRKFVGIEGVGISDAEVWNKKTCVDNSTKALEVCSRGCYANPAEPVNRESKAVWCFVPDTGPPLMYCSGKPWSKQVRVLRNKKFVPIAFRTPLEME